jgi:hypothetical protein
VEIENTVLMACTLPSCQRYMAHNLNVPYFQPIRTEKYQITWEKQRKGNLNIYRQRRKNGKQIELILSERCVSILIYYINL